MKRSMLILFFALLFTSVLSFSQADILPADSFAKYLPADTSFYIVGKDFQATETRIKELAMYKFGTSPLIEPLLKSLSKEAGNYSKITQSTDVLMKLFDIANPLLTKLEGSIEFAGNVEKQFDKNPQIALSCNMKDLTEEEVITALKLLLVGFPQLLQQLPDADLPFKEINLVEEERFGVKAYRIAPNYGGEVEPEMLPGQQYIFFNQGRMIFVSNDKFFEQIVKNMNEPLENSLATDGKFRTCYETEKGKELFTYINPSFTDKLGENIAPMGISQYINAICSSLTFNGADIEESQTIFSDFIANIPPAAILAESRVKMEATKFLPNSPYAFAAINLPPFETYGAMLRMIPQVGGFDNMIQQAIGVSPIDDILPMIGTEINIYHAASGVTQHAIAALELTDAAGLKAIIDQITAIEELGLFKKSRYIDSYDMYYYKKSPNLYPIALAFRENYLLIGDIQTLKKALKITPELSLASDQAFHTSVSHYEQQGSNILLFGDSKKLIQFGWSFAQYALKSQYINADGETETLMLPNAQQVSSFFTNQTISLKVHPDRVSIKTKGPLGISSTTPVVAAIAIPSLMNARKNSNQNVALATCKNFSTAAVDYSTSNEHQFYWEDGTVDFGDYFSHVSTRSGYSFKYFSNDVNKDGVHEATKYIYLAVPLSMENGSKVVYIDETGQLLEAIMDKDKIAKLLALDSAKFDWDKKSPERISVPGVVFTKWQRANRNARNAARRTPQKVAAGPDANQKNALATCKFFSTAAVNYAINTEEQFYWENGTVDFGVYFAHVSPKAGYNFKYFSNDVNKDGKHEATGYVFVAVPLSLETGKKAYFIDETNQLWEAAVDKDKIAKLLALDSAKFSWDKWGQERLNTPEVDFIKK